MSERFQKLYTLPSNTYIEGCPIIVLAGALQKDTQTGKVLAQIKMQNIGEKTIDSCKVSLKAAENNGKELEGVSHFSYLDLKAEPGTDFGSKTPVFFPDATTRSFSVEINEIVLADKTVMEFENSVWKPIPQKHLLKDLLHNNELEKQYDIEIKGNCKYIPEVSDGLFLCTCGAINSETNKVCCSCGRSYSALKSALDVDSLKSKSDTRLEADRLQRENLARTKEEKTAQTKKIIKIVGITIAVIIIAIGAIKAISAISAQRALENKYNEANTAFDQGNYADAISLYDELGDYEDAKEKSILSHAKQMSKLVDEKDYDQAKSCFDYLYDYENAGGKIGPAVKEAFDKYYDAAVAMVNDKNYSQAKQLFEGIVYKDSDKYIGYCSVADAVSKDLELVDLSKLYSDIKALDNFNGADELIKNNKYLSEIGSWEGTWQAVDQKGWGSPDDTEYITVTIENGYFIIDANVAVDESITIYKGRLCVNDDNYIEEFEKDTFERYAHYLDVDGDTLMYDSIDGSGFVKCVRK